MYQSFRQCKYFGFFLDGDGIDGLGFVLLMGALIFFVLWRWIFGIISVDALMRRLCIKADAFFKKAKQ